MIRRLNGVPLELLENLKFMDLMLPTLRSDFRAVETYVFRPQVPLPCPVSVFGGLCDDEVPREDLEEWSRHTTGLFQLHMLRGDHFFINSSVAPLLRLVSTTVSTTTGIGLPSSRSAHSMPMNAGSEATSGSGQHNEAEGTDADEEGQVGVRDEVSWKCLSNTVEALSAACANIAVSRLRLVRLNNQVSTRVKATVAGANWANNKMTSAGATPRPPPSLAVRNNGRCQNAQTVPRSSDPFSGP